MIKGFEHVGEEHKCNVCSCKFTEDEGGFPEQFSTSEDYFLSRQYSPKKFKIVRHHVGQDSRRFKKMGYMGMAKYLVKNFINRNNKQYWDKLDSSKYWN